MLNKQLQLICNNFPNCHFVNTATKDKYSEYLQDTCNRLNFKIDCLDYNDNYLTFNKIHTLSSSINKCNIDTNTTTLHKDAYTGKKNISQKQCVQKCILDYFSLAKKPRLCMSAPMVQSLSNISSSKSKTEPLQDVFLTVTPKTKLAT